MIELFRDTTFGHLVRYITRNRVLQWEEERDPELWKRYLNVEKSANLAKHGQVEPPENDATNNEKLDNAANGEVDDKDRTASDASDASSAGRQVNSVSGVKVDAEKGRDAHMIDWYVAVPLLEACLVDAVYRWGPDDSENPQNWSVPKKVFVTAQIVRRCVLGSCFLSDSLSTM